MSNLTIEVKNDGMLGRLNESNLHIELIKKDKEIERLNNIIDKIDKNIDIFIDERIETNKGMVFLKGGYESSMNYLRVRLHDKLQELKGSESNE